MSDRADKAPDSGAVSGPNAVPDTAPDIGPDAALRAYSGYTMKRAFTAIQSDVNATLAPFGLRMISFSALVVIADNPGLRQSDLAQILMIERPNLVVILDGLERADWITRDRAPDDRRAYQLRCTLAGTQLCAKAKAAVAAHDERMTAGLDAAQVATLIAALRQIEDNSAPPKGDSNARTQLSGP